MRGRSWLFGEFAAVSRLFGFEQFDTPVLESEELFVRKAGEEITEQLYNFEVRTRGGESTTLGVRSAAPPPDCYPISSPGPTTPPHLASPLHLPPPSTSPPAFPPPLAGLLLPVPPFYLPPYPPRRPACVHSCQRC